MRKELKEALTTTCIAVATGLVASVFLLYFLSLVFNAEAALKALGLRILIDTWNPAYGKLGIAPCLQATLLICFLVLLIATPISVLIGLALTLYVKGVVRDALRIAIDVLAGLPSVIFGLWGVYVLLPVINDYIGPVVGDTLGRISGFFAFHKSYTGNLFDAVVVLSLMVLPIMTAVIVETFRSIPQHYIEAALALGATKWQVAKTILLPLAVPGIIAGAVLGFGRVVGETMAVTMVAGVSRPPLPPSNLFSGVTPVTSLIIMEIPSLTPGFFEWNVLFAAGLIIFVLSTAAVVTGRRIARKAERGEKVVKVRGIRIRGRAALIEDSIAKALCYVVVFLVVGAMLWIISSVMVEGLAYILQYPAILVEESVMLAPSGQGGLRVAGGFLADIIGSLEVTLLSIAIAVPLGVAVAFFVTEVAPNTKAAEIARSFCQSLAATPSITLGLLGLTFFVIALKSVTGGVSLLSGALTLAILAVPYIESVVEESLKLVPKEIKESVVALGGRTYHVIQVLLKQVAPALVTGVLIAALRVFGESAPILLTAGPSNFICTSLWEPVGNMPARVYLLVFEMGYMPGARELAYAISAVLIIFVLLLNAASRIIARRLGVYRV